MTEQEKEYVKYIENHVNNIYKAYDLINEKLHEDLNYDDLELIKRINTHDASKWGKEEFEAYRQWFYPNGDDEKDKRVFEDAWRHHYRHNDHHPEYWDGLEMPDDAIAEMFCDWVAMSLNFETSLREWYEDAKARNKFVFDNLTLKKIENVMRRDWTENVHKGEV